MSKEMRAGFECMQTEFDRLEARFDRLENMQRWSIGLMVAILIAVIAGNWLG